MPASIDPIVDSRDVPLSRSAWIALVVVFALIWFANLDNRRLIHPDEGRYAEEEDWANAWKAHFPVMRIGRRRVRNH